MAQDAKSLFSFNLSAQPIVVSVSFSLKWQVAALRRASPCISWRNSFKPEYNVEAKSLTELQKEFLCLRQQVAKCMGREDSDCSLFCTFQSISWSVIHSMNSYSHLWSVTRVIIPIWHKVNQESDRLCVTFLKQHSLRSDRVRIQVQGESSLKACFLILKRTILGLPLAVKWFRLCASTSRGTGLIPWSGN